MARSSRLTALAGSLHSRVTLPPESVVVALSGGPDSAALAWLMREARIGARAVHVHHGWPGSDRMAAAAVRIADQIDLPLEIVPVVVPPGASPEAQARRVRYAALTDALEAGEVLVTGHTADDQAETVLANLLRGAGLDGLAGMPQTRGAIRRPLLGIRRDELRELAVLAGLEFVDDPANVDLTLRRNYLRHRLLGDLERAVAPGTSAALARLGALVADEVAYLDEEAARRGGDGLDAPVIATLPVPLARRAVRSALRRLGAGEGLRAQDVEAVLRIARDGGAVALPSGRIVRRIGARLVLEATAAGELARLEWDWLGAVAPGRGWRLAGHTMKETPAQFSLSSWSEVFDADRVPATVTVRPAASSDTIRMRTGHKSVRAALVEAGVGDAADWPVVAVDDDVIWIPGVRRAFTGWVGSGTRRYLCVEAVREGP